MLIRIHSHTFEISEPYSQGQRPVGAAELAALDRLRAENIRNNAAKVMNREGKWPLTGAELESFASKVAAMDQEYQFGTVIRRDGQKTGAFNRVLAEVAEDLAWQDLRRAEPGREPTGPEIRDRAAVLAQQLEVQKEARRRLEVQSEVALSAIEELL